MNNCNTQRIFAKLPVLETPRLILKEISMDNLYDMNRYASLEKTSEYLAWTPHFNIAETRGTIEFHMQQYKRGKAPDWGINHKKDGLFIGTCGFTSVDEYNSSAEIGYVLSPEYWRQGLMKEAVSAVMRISFREIGFHRLTVRIMDGNIASMKLAQSLGFVYEGALRDSMFIKGEYKTIHTFSILENEYEKFISF
ncbi:MAG: GNAT family N-acetyltransferase [Clostridia bacterium]|nr:GNAT family N-acetyltransferase [Clostridia bacterium]